MSLFPRNESTGEATTLGMRAVHLCRAVENKISQFEIQPVNAADVIFGRCNAKLREIPVEDFDAARAELTRFVKKHGCCEVIIIGEPYRLSDLIIGMDSTAELLAKYRPHFPPK